MRILAALLVSLAVVATACGSQSNTYRSQIDRVQKRCEPKLRPLELQLATAIKDRRTADAATLAGQTASLLAGCAAEIGAIDPPSGLKARADALVGAYGKLVRSLRDLETSLHAKTAKQINAAITGYNAARLAETSAIAALNGS